LNWGDLPTAFGALVALAAASVALRQAGEATKARKAAEIQAAEAQRARVAAERQAVAAEEALAEMRKQTEVMEHERVARDDQDGPTLLVAARRHRGDRHYFTVKIEDGGPEVDVAIDEARITNIDDLAVSVPATCAEPRRMVAGAPIEFAVDFVRPSKAVHVAVKFSCLEIDGRGRTWTRWTTARFSGPPIVY
jgi:hypothetical protein